MELEVLKFVLIFLANLFPCVGQQKYIIPAALYSHSTEILPLLRPNRNHTLTRTHMHPWNLAFGWAKWHKDLLSVCTHTALLLTSLESQPIITAVQSQGVHQGFALGPLLISHARWTGRRLWSVGVCGPNPALNRAHPLCGGLRLRRQTSFSPLAAHKGASAP